MNVDPQAALEYASKHTLDALVVWHDGRIVEEAYGERLDGSTPHALYSGSKSFWGITALCAEREGLLALDEPVADTFPRWGAHPWKSRVTLRHLLQLTSGIGFGGLGQAVPTYEKALDVELKDEPGKKFTYGGIPLQVFGAVLARKLEPRGLTPHEYLQQRVLDPIGMRVAKWRTLADGTRPLPTGASVAAHEWLKYARFICEHRDEFAPCFEGSSANAPYGLDCLLGARGALLASGALKELRELCPE